MDQWLAVRGALAGTMTVSGLLVVLVLAGDLAVPMLSMTVMAEFAMPVSLVAPVALALVLTWALSRGDERLEGISVRPLATYDAVMALCLVGFFACVAIILDVMRFTDLGLEAARNACGLVGIALLVRWFRGSVVAGIVPVVYVILVGFFGGETMRTAEWWAWLVSPADSTTAASQAGGMFVLGLILTSIGRRQRPALR